MRSSILTGLITGLITGGLLVAPAVATAAEPRPGVVAEVTARMRAEAFDMTATATTPRVTVRRQDDRWAFGTAVLATAPESDAMPEGWLFVAHRDGARWEVALEGEPACAELSAEAPLVTDAERPLLSTQDGTQPGAAAGGDGRTGMALPYAVGQTWGMPGGPHGWGGQAPPWSSLDLSAPSKMAPRSGPASTLPVMCRSRSPARLSSSRHSSYARLTSGT